MIYTGNEAKKVLEEILANSEGSSYPLHKGATGYYWDENVFVAFDNTTCDCWVEEFITEEGAKKWIDTSIDD